MKSDTSLSHISALCSLSPLSSSLSPRQKLYWILSVWSWDPPSQQPWACAPGKQLQGKFSSALGLFFLAQSRRRIGDYRYNLSCSCSKCKPLLKMEQDCAQNLFQTFLFVLLHSQILCESRALNIHMTAIWNLSPV